MQINDAPDKLVLPFADAGGKNIIPVSSNPTPGGASFTDGFPPLTRTPIVSGGIPPSGLDMNGVLFDMSAVDRWQSAGAGYIYDSAYATDIGGYPAGSKVLFTDHKGYWINTVDDNSTDPEAGGAGWAPGESTGSTAVTMTNANVTLTSLQAAKDIIIISGVLVSNLNLIFPTYQKNWTVVNNCTGAFSVTCKTASGTGVALAISTAQILYGNGTNILAATSIPITTLPTTTILTSGTSYTTIANARQLRVRLVGAGGGGAGGGGAGATTGGNGGTTTFNSVNAVGGNGGGVSGSASGSGGTGGTGSATFRAPGAPGVAGSTNGTGTTSGGVGGSSQLGGGSIAGTNAAANTGAGGGGGSAVNAATGTGGGSGEFVELIINSPTTTYSYAIGTGGTAGAAGSGGSIGGIGGSGLIIVDEIY